MPKEQMSNPSGKMKGNGLGMNNAKSWNPASVPAHNARGGSGFSPNPTQVESHFRKGAGAKQ